MQTEDKRAQLIGAASKRLSLLSAAALFDSEDDLVIETKWQKLQEHYEWVKIIEELELRAKRAYHRRFGTKAPLSRVAVFDEDSLIDLDNGNEPVGQYRILPSGGIRWNGVPETLSYCKIARKPDGSVSVRRTTAT